MSTLAQTRRIGRRLPAILAIGLLLAALTPGTAFRPLAARAVDCTVNPIPCENQLPGTDPSIWDTPNGDAGDASLQGFATDISVNVGQTVSFKINSSGLRSYSIDIYRLGYYQGNGARKITTISPSVSLPQTQPACLTDRAPAWSTAATGRCRPRGASRPPRSRASTSPGSPRHRRS